MEAEKRLRGMISIFQPLIQIMEQYLIKNPKNNETVIYNKE
jgi:hypothetical protein